LATIIAFYFGIRGSESSAEKARRSDRSEKIKDLTIPSVLKTKPVDGGDNVHINTDIYAKFNEPMDLPSINKTTFTIVNSKNNKPVDGEISLIENNTKALFKTSSLTYVTKYITTIESEVTDVEGNHMLNNKVWSFTTGEKELTIQPQSKIPSAGQKDVDPITTREISFKFNKDIDANTITPANIQIVEGKIELILSPDSIKVDISEKNKVLIELPKNLSLGTTYTIKVSRAVKDIDGNILIMQKNGNLLLKQNNKIYLI
jgi:hypothetical protein